MNKCKIQGCTNKVHAKGYCGTHYHYQLRHNGNPIPPKRKFGSITVQGYHRFTIGNKSYRTHRYILEEHLGRKLLKTEIVHHIDGNKLNNSLNNLLICQSPLEHSSFHHKEFVIDGKKQCTKCKKWLPVKQYFSFNKRENRWGRWCKSCQKAHDRLRYISKKRH